MNFQIWKLRIILLMYIVYKMLLSTPLPSLSTILRLDELNEKTGARYVGHIIGTSLPIMLAAWMFESIFFHHIGQGISEFKSENIYTKNKFRLSGILFTGLFFLIAGMSLFNTGNRDVSVLLELNSWLNLYTVFTLISIVAAFSTVGTDIKMYRKSKRLENKT